ncbi:hypothetical protein CC79DRAFT_822311 [Sarocladium strictum]
MVQSRRLKALKCGFGLQASDRQARSSLPNILARSHYRCSQAGLGCPEFWAMCYLVPWDCELQCMSGCLRTTKGEIAQRGVAWYCNTFILGRNNYPLLWFRYSTIGSKRIRQTYRMKSGYARFKLACSPFVPQKSESETKRRFGSHVRTAWTNKTVTDENSFE